MRPEVAAGVKAGWLTFPTDEFKPRVMSRTYAQAVEAFDVEMARRMADNGVDRKTIARAIGCRVGSVNDLLKAKNKGAKL